MNISEFRKIVKEEIDKILMEKSVNLNTSNVHPWVLTAMEELKDDLEFYLGPKNNHSNSKIDFDLLKSKCINLVKRIKQYHPKK